jgi:hypothetical protein
MYRVFLENVSVAHVNKRVSRKTPSVATDEKLS